MERNEKWDDEHRACEDLHQRLRADMAEVAARYRGRNLTFDLLDELRRQLEALFSDQVRDELGLRPRIVQVAPGRYEVAIMRANVCTRCWGEGRILDVTEGDWSTCHACGGKGRA